MSVCSDLEQLGKPEIANFASLLRDAAKSAAIDGQDREGKMLRNLPASAEEDIQDWIAKMNATEGNATWLIDCLKYTQRRIDGLKSTASEIADSLSGLDDAAMAPSLPSIETGSDAVIYRSRPRTAGNRNGYAPGHRVHGWPTAPRL